MKYNNLKPFFFIKVIMKFLLSLDWHEAELCLAPGPMTAQVQYIPRIINYSLAS